MENQYQEIKLKLNNKKNTELRSQLQQIDICSEDGENMVEKYEDMMQRLMLITEDNSENDKVYCELFLYLGEQARSLLENAESKRK